MPEKWERQYSDDELRRLVHNRLRLLQYEDGGGYDLFGSGSVDVTNPNIGAGTVTTFGNPSIGGDPFASGIGVDSSVDLSGASLASVTPNPSINNVGLNTGASAFSALANVFDQFGGTIAGMMGGPQTVTQPQIIQTSAPGPNMGMILLLIGVAAIVLLIFSEEK